MQKCAPDCCCFGSVTWTSSPSQSCTSWDAAGRPYPLATPDFVLNPSLKIFCSTALSIPGPLSLICNKSRCSVTLSCKFICNWAAEFSKFLALVCEEVSDERKKASTALRNICINTLRNRALKNCICFPCHSGFSVNILCTDKAAPPDIISSLNSRMAFSPQIRAKKGCCVFKYVQKS